MLVREAEWIARQLADVPDARLFPLLNVGSSTQAFRSQVQPHIDDVVFSPLRGRGGQVIHVDMKADPGVDLVGAVGEPRVDARLRQLNVRSALVSNLLEHVEDRHAVARAVLDVVPPGGHIIVTGPRRFPYHPDPIDNRFRPTVDEAAALFPGTTRVAGAIIDSGNWRTWDVRERAGRSPSRLLIRLLLPFYRPRNWLDAARQVPYLVRSTEAFGLVLQKR